MLKGFYPIVSAVFLLAVIPDLQAQVYRCEGPSGTVFSDMPCGESAEEIVVEGMEPEPEAEERQDSAAAEVPDENQSYRNFVGMLNSQKQSKIEEVDGKLLGLRNTLAGPDSESMTEMDRKQLNDQIAELEQERESAVAEYDGLIAEMESRIETDDTIVTAQGQLQQ